MKVLNIQRMSTEDGPGLRTTLFVKGCPLKCKWCHNPESIACESSIEWFFVRCMGCNTCFESCPTGALKQGQDGILWSEEKCTRCFKCEEVCPTGAIEVKGIDMSVDELFSELIKDKAFFGEDGGITLSGGEICIQYKEAAQLLEMLGTEEIHRALDTCGLCQWEHLNTLLPHTDLVLYDLKLYDLQEHIEWTGADNKLILENFEKLCHLREQGAKFELWVRTPIIPDATDSTENIKALAEVVRNRVDRWELCAFNNLCVDKYERLGSQWEFLDKPLMRESEMEFLLKIAESTGAKNVLYTGRTRMEE
ncbi:MAG: glycyl-radical enzyme activating protein [Ruminococcaceae bacterium]|nr:glycyl-radical enzyme activating protein [Oscillospiraceae bacterium]